MFVDKFNKALITIVQPFFGRLGEPDYKLYLLPPSPHPLKNIACGRKRIRRAQIVNRPTILFPL